MNKDKHRLEAKLHGIGEPCCGNCKYCDHIILIGEEDYRIEGG